MVHREGARAERREQATGAVSDGTTPAGDGPPTGPRHRPHHKGGLRDAARREGDRSGRGEAGGASTHRGGEGGGGSPLGPGPPRGRPPRPPRGPSTRAEARRMV